MSEPVAIGIDVGGTKIAVGAVYGNGRLENFSRMPTATTTLDVLAEAAGDLAAQVEGRAGIVGVGVGICELVDDDRQTRSATSVAWTASELDAALGHLGPVTVEADVRAAALAEARFGAGRPVESFLYVTVGTGISHCLVVGGEPYRGAHGCAQLSGSAVLSFRCPHCSEGIKLSVEDVASGAALASASADGSAVDDAVATLGSFVALLVNVLDPAAVVVGGGLGSAHGAYWRGLEQALRDHIWAEHARNLPIMQAELGADAGVIGAGWMSIRAAGSELHNTERVR
jgi:glucokinase